MQNPRRGSPLQSDTASSGPAPPGNIPEGLCLRENGGGAMGNAEAASRAGAASCAGPRARSRPALGESSLAPRAMRRAATASEMGPPLMNGPDGRPPDSRPADTSWSWRLSMGLTT
eukprot:9501169-Pyramimonas_sp.AAC.1